MHLKKNGLGSGKNVSCKRGLDDFCCIKRKARLQIPCSMRSLNLCRDGLTRQDVKTATTTLRTFGSSGEQVGGERQ
jgi:hypothetical protein